MRQKGEVAIITAAAYLIAGFVVLVTNGLHNPGSLVKAEAPAPVAQVCSNYNNIGCK